MDVIPLRNAQHPLAENTPPALNLPTGSSKHNHAIGDVFIIEDAPQAHFIVHVDPL